MENNIIYEKKNNIATISINRPEVLNALSIKVLQQLEALLEEIKNDNSIRVLVLTGAGKAFVAGADIEEMSGFNIDEAKEYSIYGSKVFRNLELLPFPTIAMVNGYALGGGCELAMACDIIYASDKAKFGQPETGLGITPGFSGTQRLFRKVGVPKAKELIFTSKIISADEAKSIGLVNEVFSHENLNDEVYKTANQIAMNAPLAISYGKACIERGSELPIDEGINVEAELFSKCFATGDQNEGMQAFIEKRKPTFVKK